MTFKKADDEFQKIAGELFREHKVSLGLTVDPVKISFLRSDKKKKSKGKTVFAYTKLIHGEYAFLTEKKFFIVIVCQNYDELDDKTKKLQLQFNYWISMFEAKYGDILIFYNNFDASNSEKLIAINNLLNNLIQTTNE